MIRALLEYSALVFFFVLHTLFALYNRLIKRTLFPKLADDEFSMLLQISAREAASSIRERKVSAQQFVEAYVRRAMYVNRLLNAVREDNYDAAFEEAAAIDDHLATADAATLSELETTKPLLGVPFIVVDTLKCANLHTCCGLASFIEAPVNAADAEVVTRLRAAGAIVLATVNVSEAMLGWECVSTVSERSVNPYDARRICGGDAASALIAAAGAIVGVGSEFNGSMRLSALLCGVFCLKPSPKLVPIAGHVPENMSPKQREMLAIAPICRYAADLPLLLQLLVGPETSARLRLNEPISLRRVRVFHMRGLETPLVSPLHVDCAQALNKAAKYFEKKYDMATYCVDFPIAKYAPQLYCTSARRHSMSVGHRLAGFSSANSVHLIFESIRWLVGKSDHTAGSLLAQSVDELPEIVRSNADFVISKREQLKRDVVDLLGSDGVLLVPGAPRSSYYHNEPLFCPFDNAYASLWNTLGLPTLTAPMGLNANGIPTGIQVVGGVDSERLLVTIAHDLEEGFGGWALPHPDLG